MNYAPPPKPKPHGALYLVPVFIWIAFSIGALVAAGVGAVSGLEERADELARVPASQGGTVDVEEGSNTIYYEESGGGSTVSSPPDLGLQLLDPGGDPISVSTSSGTSTYTAGGRSGIAIGSFNAERTGTYTIVVDDPFGMAAGGTLAVGDDVLTGAAKSGVVPLLVIGSIGFLIALVIAIVIARKRGNSKRQIQQSYAGGGGFGPPGGGYGAPGSQPPHGGYGAPGSYPPPGGSQQPGGYGAPGSYPPPGGSQQPGGYPPPPPGP